jgi:HSP20 family molecular chaperone IbpA
MSAFHLLNEFRPLFRLLEEPLPQSFAVSPNQFSRARQLPLPRFEQPSVDLHEEDDRYIVEAEVPGVRKEDLKVSVTEGGRGLTISGSRSVRSTASFASESSPETSSNAPAEPVQSNTEGSTDGKLAQLGNVTLRLIINFAAIAKVNNTAEQQVAPSIGTSTSSFRFSRSVYLPERVDPATLSAKLENGILMVEIPKVKVTEATEIKIL